MGFSMRNLEYLSNKGYLANPQCSFLDIGSQNLYHATPEAIRAFVEKHGGIKNKESFEEEAKRISYFSWPRPGERTSYLSELLDLTSFSYTSYDVCPALKTEIFDLNEEHLPAKYKEYFDVVLNFGTTEHIFNQLNSFRVIHDALKVDGIAFHQLPSVGWIDHGYFCYHSSFFDDLAKANHYEIVDRWFTLAGQTSLAGSDVRDAEKPEQPQSSACDQNLLTIPSFNFNIILRKRTSCPFAVGLELATSHFSVSPEIAALYAGGSRDFSKESVEAAWEAKYGITATSGKALARELGRRIMRRLGITRKAAASVKPSAKSVVADEDKTINIPLVRTTAPIPQTQKLVPPPVPPETGAPSVSVTDQIVMPESTLSDAMSCVTKGRQLLEQGAIPQATGYLYQALTIVHQFPHAVIELQKISDLYRIAGERSFMQGNRDKALWFSVAAIEANPKSTSARDLLARIDNTARTDITRQCYVFYDPQRAETIHRETIRRCLEYTAIAGVTGDIMEFGVLGGWSARLFSETMRDLMVMGNLHLFDSFEGLPDYTSPIDKDSFEIAGRNIWADKMKFPQEFVNTLGSSLDQHIQHNLSYVIRPERIKVRRGFYADTLAEPISAKAALVHIDCDLYQSTVEVLKGLQCHDVLQDGCVLLFDDWNCNKANPAYGERRAFKEFLENQQRFTASNFFTYGFNGAAFILHDTMQ